MFASKNIKVSKLPEKQYHKDGIAEGIQICLRHFLPAIDTRLLYQFAIWRNETNTDDAFAPYQQALKVGIGIGKLFTLRGYKPNEVLGESFPGILDRYGNHKGLVQFWLSGNMGTGDPCALIEMRAIPSQLYGIGSGMSRFDLLPELTVIKQQASNSGKGEDSVDDDLRMSPPVITPASLLWFVPGWLSCIFALGWLGRLDKCPLWLRLLGVAIGLVLGVLAHFDHVVRATVKLQRGGPMPLFSDYFRNEFTCEPGEYGNGAILVRVAQPQQSDFNREVFAAQANGF